MDSFEHVAIEGGSLNSQGFVALDFYVALQPIQGLGLNTFGFLWPGIWEDCEDVISTTWTECE